LSEIFEKNLSELRKLYPVKTICMHGSPLSKYDNKLLWKYYDYKKLGILAEPYFDIDFNQLFYLTDTGRCWDGHRFNVRDKPMTRAGDRTEDRSGDNASARAGDTSGHSTIQPSNHSTTLEQRGSAPQSTNQPIN